jgi:hypothetical protein
MKYIKTLPVIIKSVFFQVPRIHSFIHSKNVILACTLVFEIPPTPTNPTLKTPPFLLPLHKHTPEHSSPARPKRDVQIIRSAIGGMDN